MQGCSVAPWRQDVYEGDESYESDESYEGSGDEKYEKHETSYGAKQIGEAS